LIATVMATAFLGASSARADYCQTVSCTKSDGMPGTKTQCCDDPNAPPTAPEVCGQLVVGTTNVAGGCTTPQGGTGCFGEFQQDGSPCGDTAAAACVLCGCFHETFCN